MELLPNSYARAPQRRVETRCRADSARGPCLPPVRYCNAAEGFKPQDAGSIVRATDHRRDGIIQWQRRVQLCTTSCTLQQKPSPLRRAVKKKGDKAFTRVFLSFCRQPAAGITSRHHREKEEQRAVFSWVILHLSPQQCSGHPGLKKDRVHLAWTAHQNSIKTNRAAHFSPHHHSLSPPSTTGLHFWSSK